MHRRNPLSLNRRRRAGPPPWPPAHEIAAFRRALVSRRGLPPEAHPDDVEELRARGAWWRGVDMRRAPDAAVMHEVFVWLAEQGIDPLD